MGQAKNRKAEIDALKASGPKVKSNKSGFLPDAGLNSSEGINHYWFQVAELVQHLTNYTRHRAYKMDGIQYTEFNVPVDIMDQAGNQHTAPHTEQGYFATFRLSMDQMLGLADSIARGAMSVRIDGMPMETETAPSGEQFRVIEVLGSWSAGNDRGLMTYMVATNKGMITTDSTKVAQHFRNLKDHIANVA